MTHDLCPMSKIDQLLYSEFFEIAQAGVKKDFSFGQKFHSDRVRRIQTLLDFKADLGVVFNNLIRITSFDLERYSIYDHQYNWWSEHILCLAKRAYK